MVILNSAAIAADARDAGCEYDLANVPAAPRYADYPVAPGRLRRPAAPSLVSRQARLLRTVLQDATAKGPNFAGHDTIAVWGCGASCTSGAIVDGRSGRVFFPEAMNDIAGMHVAGRQPDGSEPAYYSLRFRADSRLIAILGAAGEDDARDGVSYYAWTGAGLRLVRFFPRSVLCGPQASR